MSVSEIMFLLLGLLAGLVVAGLLAQRVGRQRIAEARDAGRGEREPELAALARDLKALADQRDELKTRLAALDTDYRQVWAILDDMGALATQTVPGLGERPAIFADEGDAREVLAELEGRA